MTISQAWIRVMRIAMLAASMFVLVSFNRYASEPATVADVIRVSAALPGVSDRSLKTMLPRAALYRLNYLSEAAISLLYSTGRTLPVTSVRMWDGVVAVLAIWLLYRVGCMCADQVTGVLACIVLALVPPQSWYLDSVRIVAVLLHFLSFLYAVRKDTMPLWIVFVATTALLFCTGVYAEPLLLPAWCVVLGAVWALWHVCARRLHRNSGFADTPDDARPQHHSRSGPLMKQIQRDAGLLRFVCLLMIVTIISFGLVFVTGVFFSQFTLTVPTVLAMSGTSIVLSVLSGGVMLMIPVFVRERTIIIDHILIGNIFGAVSTPDHVFRPVRCGGVHRALGSYAVASCIFLPVLFVLRASMSQVSPDYGVRAFISHMAHAGTAGDWAMLAAPFLFVVVNVLGYRCGGYSRGRVIGSCALFLPSSLYLVQPRYAIFSVPFCLLCMTGLIVSTCRLVLGYVRQRLVHSAEERPAHAL